MRRDASLIISLRSSHTALLKAFADHLDIFIDPICRNCGEQLETIEHCPNALAMRRLLFGEPSPPLSVLTTDPGSVQQSQQKQQQQFQSSCPYVLNY